MLSTSRSYVSTSIRSDVVVSRFFSVLLTTAMPILAISFLGFSFSSAANAVTISLLLLAESDANGLADPCFGIGEGADFLLSLPFRSAFFEPPNPLKKARNPSFLATSPCWPVKEAIRASGRMASGAVAGGCHTRVSRPGRAGEATLDDDRRCGEEIVDDLWESSGLSSDSSAGCLEWTESSRAVSPLEDGGPWMEVVTDPIDPLRSILRPVTRATVLTYTSPAV
mmetsp:Transcript_34112/g.57316  ORF Transcript_34112/g.57316 Transcript_34112/m.57316 type:complete len:225 (+) Transcript_34112:254-928(+)